MFKHFSKFLISLAAGLAFVGCVIGTAGVLANHIQSEETNTKQELVPHKAAKVNLTSSIQLSDSADYSVDGFTYTYSDHTIVLNGCDLEFTGNAVANGISYAGSSTIVFSITPGTVNTIRHSGYQKKTAGYVGYTAFVYHQKFIGNGTLNVYSPDLSALSDYKSSSHCLAGTDITIGSGTDNPIVNLYSGKVGTYTGSDSSPIIGTNFTINSGTAKCVGPDDTNGSYGFYQGNATAISLTMNKGSMLLTGQTSAIYSQAQITTSGSLTAYGSATYNDTVRNSKASYDSSTYNYNVYGTSTVAKTVIFQGPEIDLSAYGSDIVCLPAASYDLTTETYLSDFSSSSFSTKWYSDVGGTTTASAPAATQLSVDISSLTKAGQDQKIILTTTSSSVAGTYYLAVAYGTVVSNIITVNIVKADQTTGTSVTVDYADEKLTGYDAANYEYSLTGDFTDSASCTSDLSSSGSLTSLISASADVSVYVRKKATAQYNASASQTVVLTKRAAAPTAAFTAGSATSGALTSIDDTMEYSIDNGSTWTSVASGVTSIADLTVSAGNHLKVRYQAVANTSFASVAEDLGTISKADTPTTGVFSATSDTTGTISGVTDTMQYSLDGGSTFTDVPSGSTSVSVTVASGAQVKVRVKPTGNVLASDWEDLGTISKAAALTGTYTFTAKSDSTGTLTGVDTTMEYSLDSGATWQKVTAAPMDVTGVVAGKDIKVRTAGTGTVLASDSTTVASVTQGTTPSGAAFTATGDTTGTITGVTDTMEYTSDGGTNWTAVPAGKTSVDLTGLTTSSHIEVRVAAKDTKLASTAQDLGNPTQASQPTTGSFAATSDTAGTITGVTDAMEYSIDGGTTWTKVTTGATSVDLTNLTSGKDIKIRVAATDTVLASASQDLGTLTKGTTPTTGTFAATSTSAGTLSGVTDTMEYSTDGGTNWTKVTAGATSVDLTGLTVGDHIEVRAAATGTVLASDIKDLGTLTQPSVPATTAFAATSDTAGTISNVNDTMQYSTDGGSTWANVSAGATSVNLTGLNTTSHIEVRVAPNGTALMSETKDLGTLTQSTKPAATFTATSDTTGTISGVDDTMKYSIDGGTNWTAVPSGTTEVKLTGLTTSSHIEIMVPASGTKLASPVDDLGNPTQAATPTTGTFAATSDTEATLSGVDDTMEYTTDGGTTWTKVATGETTADLTELTTSSHIEVRVAATGTELASAAQDLGSPTKATAPTTGTFTATSDSTGTLTNVDTTMEYSIDSGSTWHKVTGTSMELTNVLAGNDVEVRTAASGTELASDPYTVASVTKGATPTTAVFTATSDTTGTISGVDTTMEYSVDNGSNWTKVASGTSVNVTVTEGDKLRVRVAANGSMLASESQWLGDVNKAQTPTAGTFTATSDSTGTLTNVDTNMEYSLDSGATWQKVTGTSMDVSGVVAGKDIEVRVASEGLYLASDPYKVASVTKGATPTTAGFTATSDTLGTITGLNNTMEYSLDGGTNWVKVTGTATTAMVNVTAGTVIKVRTAATSTVLASEAQTLDALTQAATPTSTYNNEGVISGLSNNTSYVVTYTDASGNTKTAVIVSSSTGTITVNASENSALFGTTVTAIQAQATGSVLASPEQNGLAYEMKLTMATPTAAYDSDTSVLSNLTEGTSYKLTFSDGTSTTVTTKTGETSLTLNTIDACLGKTISGVTALKTNDNYRDSAEEAITATKAIKFTYADPTPSVDIGKEVITGLTAGETYVINNGSASSELVADATGAIAIPEPFIGTTVTVTHEALDQTKYISSNGVSVDIPSRATEPTASSLTYTALTDGTVKVTGVDSTMEYQIGTDGWKDVTGTSVVAPAGGKLHIRIKATSTTMASKEIAVDVPEAVSTPTAAADLDQDKLTGLTAGGTYVIDGSTLMAGTDGTIAIDPTWYGKTIEIVAKGDGTKIDSAAQKLPIASIADQIATYAADAESEVTAAGSNGTAATEDVRAIVDKYVSDIEAVKSQGLTKANAQTAIDNLKTVALNKIAFQKEKEKVTAELQSLARDCQGKDKVQGYINDALTEVGKKTFENSSIAELDKIYTDTKEKVNLTLNQEVLPNRLTTLVTDLTGSYPYTDENKATIASILKEYETKIAAATTTAEQESLYTEAVTKIKDVETGEVKTTNQGTSYPDGYDYQTDGLYGTVDAAGLDANATLTATYTVESNGQSQLDASKISQTYVGTVTLTSNEEATTGDYKVKVMLPSGTNHTATYKVVDKNGKVIEAKIDADGNLTFEASALGEYKVVTDYAENHLLYIVIPLLIIILAEIVYALIELKKIKKHAHDLDELEESHKGEVKAAVSLLPLFGLMVLSNTTIVTLGTTIFIVIECLVIFTLAIVDFLLYMREKAGQQELDKAQNKAKATQEKDNKEK
jgi:hypothetical protein